jgi:methyl-accepting chemotaxis protein
VSSRRIPIAAKLYGGFAAVLILAVVVGVTALSNMGSMNRETTTVVATDLPALGLIATINAAEGDYRATQLQHVVSSDQATMARWERDLVTRRREIAAAFSRYAPLTTSAKDRADWQLARRQWDGYLRTSGGFLAQSRANHQAAAMAVLDGAAGKQFAALSADLDAWAKANDEYAAADAKRAANSYHSARSLTIILLLVAIALGGAVAFFITRGIRRVVAGVLERLATLREHESTELKVGLEHVAEGDLTVEVTPVTPPIESWSNDELGDVAQAVNGIRENTIASVDAYNASRASLADMIGEVRQTAVAVSSASKEMATTSEETGRAVGEIARAVGDVAQGSERQVRAVAGAQQVSAEVANATSESADNASRTAASAEQAAELAGEGAAAIGQATDAMAAVRAASEGATQAIRSLGAKSGEIGGIVQTITGIAEQTNLLALNAAIEAARAGEQGRGFAVVAEEVRKLAEESQAAAASIASLIAKIQAETDKAVTVVEDGAARTGEGAATVEQARDAFARIGEAVGEMNGRVSEIAGAVQQISVSSERMQTDMAEIAAVAEESSASTEQVSASTQQTSASAQQIAASAQELARTAEQLEGLVGRFTLAA